MASYGKKFLSSSSVSLQKLSIVQRARLLPNDVTRTAGIIKTSLGRYQQCNTVAISSQYCQFFSTKSQNSSNLNKKDLYSRMGLSPKATQKQIKEAYYKLSMKYHPDRNHDNPDATHRFREITEAYSVLGDNHTRRKYDRGLLREYPSPVGTPQTPPPFTGTATSKDNHPKYNFDAFYQAHYGEALKREQKAKAKRAEQKETKTRALSDVQQQLLIITVVSLVLVCGWHFAWGWYSKELKKQTNALMREK